MQQIVAIGSGGIPQVDDGHLIPVGFADAAVVAVQVAFGVAGEKGHPGGAGVFQIGIQPVGGLAAACRAHHHGVDIGGVYQSVGPAANTQGPFPPGFEHQSALGFAANHDALRQFLLAAFWPKLPPALRGEGYFPIIPHHFPRCGEPGGAMLTVSHRPGLDAVQVIHMGGGGDQAQNRQHGSEDQYQQCASVQADASFPRSRSSFQSLPAGTRIWHSIRSFVSFSLIFFAAS